MNLFVYEKLYRSVLNLLYADSFFVPMRYVSVNFTINPKGVIVRAILTPHRINPQKPVAPQPPAEAYTVKKKASTKIEHMQQLLARKWRARQYAVDKRPEVVYTMRHILKWFSQNDMPCEITKYTPRQVVLRVPLNSLRLYCETILNNFLISERSIEEVCQNHAIESNIEKKFPCKQEEKLSHL